tara:strand:- start:542 stop:646 length:105 start_codon:yes stop_codon:yes gene_type:complete
MRINIEEIKVRERERHTAHRNMDMDIYENIYRKR